jgi:hypothetical protein
MIDNTALRKNKISLTDYDYKRDIENRLLLARFTSFDLSVLEEILYSSLNISLKKLAKDLSVKEEKLLPTLEKFQKMKLLSFKGDSITVDKEKRKYYEFQILNFDEDFCPGMEYLQGLLRKVPMHCLPVWYSIPRTSNNIFDSLIEKYLLTPQIFSRYLSELNFPDSTLSSIIDEVFSSPDLKVRVQDLMDKYRFSHEEVEEYILTLEFNFICCLGYQKNGDKWEEIVTPFHEWREYLSFISSTEAKPLADSAKIVKKRPEDFSFVQDMGHLLFLTKKSPLKMSTKNAIGVSLPEASSFSTLAAKFKGLKEDHPSFLPYLHEIVSKLCLLKLARIEDGHLHALESAQEWLLMSLENRALHLYRSPLNQILSVKLPAEIATDRHIREAEKSISRVLDSGWVYFEDFIQGVHVSFSPAFNITLKKTGKNWKYHLPCYSTDERALIKATIFELLFQSGMVLVGTHAEKECFCVTDLGRSLFGH